MARRVHVHAAEGRQLGVEESRLHRCQLHRLGGRIPVDIGRNVHGQNPLGGSGGDAYRCHVGTACSDVKK